MAGKIRVIEGVCCAGKTTLIRQMAAELKAGVVPELPEFGRNLLRPFTDGDAVYENGCRSIPIEIVRMMGAIGLSKIAEHVIMDRSYISTLALGYGAIDLIGSRAYRILTEKVLTSICSGELPVADNTFYVSVDIETVQMRNETRVPKLDGYWVDPARIERQNAFYRNLAQAEGIQIIDGARAREEVLADCIDLARSPLPTQNVDKLVIAIEEFNSHVR